MAAPGFTDLPSTQHFAFEYNNLLNANEAKALGEALAATAERDFATMKFWFSGTAPVGPIDTKINMGDGGASNDNVNNINLRLGSTADFNLARYTLVAEVMEIFMAKNPFGWKPGNSSGEGLSQLGALTIYPDQVDNLNGPQVWLDTSISPTAAKPSRPDFVNKTEASDANFTSFGCALLFLYFLRSQLGFSMKAIVSSHAVADTLEGVYANLTKDHDAFPTFSNLLERAFPSGTPAGLVGSTDPFPLPSSARLSVKQFMANNEMDPRLIGQVVRANRELGNLRALLNSNRPVSMIR
jgi:hypothetical protein